MNSSLYNIYLNILNCFKYRKVAPISPLEFKKFNTGVNAHGYIVITSKYDSEDMIALLFSSGSEIIGKSKELLVVLSSLSISLKCNLMIVSDGGFTDKTLEIIKQFKESHNGLYVENYPYNVFSLVVPEHKLVPKHEIATDAEVTKYCFDRKTTKNTFAKISHTDPMTAWIGLRRGQCVKITRLSEIAGESLVYRYCE